MFSFKIFAFLYVSFMKVRYPRIEFVSVGISPKESCSSIKNPSWLPYFSFFLLPPHFHLRLWFWCGNRIICFEFERGEQWIEWLIRTFPYMDIRMFLSINRNLVQIFEFDFPYKEYYCAILYPLIVFEGSLEIPTTSIYGPPVKIYRVNLLRKFEHFWKKSRLSFLWPKTAENVSLPLFPENFKKFKKACISDAMQ